MQHLGGADAVDDVDAEVRLEAFAEFGGQRLAGRGGTRRIATSPFFGRFGEASMPAKPVGAP